MPSSYSRIAAVSGANKGIGLAIVRQLAIQWSKSSFNSGSDSLLIYLGSRDNSRGQAALDELLQDKQLKDAKALSSDGGLAHIKLAELDISNSKSIDNFVDFVKKEHGQIDFFIGNAGIAMQGFNLGVVQETLATNYYGTLEATEKILPLIKEGGRFVNVSSMAGKLGKYSPSIRDRFLSSSSVQDVTKLMQEFQSAVKQGNEKEQGWPSAAYAVSKSGVTAFTRAIAMEEQKRGRGVLVNSMCPGYVQTEMTRGGGVKTPDEGAQTAVLLAIGDIKGQSGLFWQHEKPIEWNA